MQINFISKVTRVLQATRNASEASLCFAILVLFLELSSRSAKLKCSKPFSQVRKSCLTRKAVAKSQKLIITELFYSHSFNMNRGSHHSRSLVFRKRSTENARGFQETGHTRATAPLPGSYEELRLFLGIDLIPLDMINFSLYI